MFITAIDLISDKIVYLIQNNEGKLFDLNGMPFNVVSDNKIRDINGNFFRFLSNLPTPPLPDTFYSNFDQYIINGVRQATTSVTIRGNSPATRRFIVTETVEIESITLLRIPPSNWTSTLNYNINGTLSVFSDGTIDGTSSSKSFVTSEILLSPTRLGGLDEFDTYKLQPSNLSKTILTPGEYNLEILGTSANMSIATLTNTIFPIDTTRPIHPSPTAATTHFAMEIL